MAASAPSLDTALDDVVGHLPKGGGGRRRLLMFALPVLLLAGAGGALFATGKLDGLIGGIAAEAVAEEPAVDLAAPGTFFEMPDFIVNLNTTDRRQSFLKLSLSLELNSPDDVASIEAVMPRIVDAYQLYLRELRLEDLRGSAGAYRLRQELLRRVNGATAPGFVRNVLLREMLVQ